MHFAFDDEQLAFRHQLRAFAEARCPASALRAVWGATPPWSAERLAGLAELGVVGLTVPEDHGGLGLGQLEMALLLEEAGRAGLPEPLLESTALAAPLLAEAGGELAEAWLGRLAAGQAVVTVGEPGETVVAAAVGASLVLVVADGTVVAVPAGQAAITPVESVDGTRGLGRVGYDRAAAEVVATGDRAAALVDRLVARGALGTAALLAGVGRRLVDEAAAYAVDRVQFGRPIGSYQAVKHRLADAAVGLEFARPLVYRAAWSLDHHQPAADVHASMAKAAAADAARDAARAALQVHGAIGYTWEHDLHLWMKRAWSLSAAWGDATWHRARVLEAAVAAPNA